MDDQVLDMDCVEELQAPLDPVEEASLTALTAAEDHLATKQEVIELQRAAASGIEGIMSEESAAAKSTDADGGDADPPLVQHSGSNTTSMRILVKQLSDMEAFTIETEDDTGYSRCLERLILMRAPIQQFVENVRLQEGVLSKAQILTHRKLGEWQAKEHQLALARQASMQDFCMAIIEGLGIG